MRRMSRGRKISVGCWTGRLCILVKSSDSDCVVCSLDWVFVYEHARVPNGRQLNRTRIVLSFPLVHTGLAIIMINFCFRGSHLFITLSLLS
jgi:hypothetical protein